MELTAQPTVLAGTPFLLMDSVVNQQAFGAVLGVSHAQGWAYVQFQAGQRCTLPLSLAEAGIKTLAQVSEEVACR